MPRTSLWGSWVRQNPLKLVCCKPFLTEVFHEVKVHNITLYFYQFDAREMLCWSRWRVFMLMVPCRYLFMSMGGTSRAVDHWVYILPLHRADSLENQCLKRQGRLKLGKSRKANLMLQMGKWPRLYLNYTYSGASCHLGSCRLFRLLAVVKSGRKPQHLHYPCQHFGLPWYFMGSVVQLLHTLFLLYRPSSIWTIFPIPHHSLLVRAKMPSKPWHTATELAQNTGDAWMFPLVNQFSSISKEKSLGFRMKNELWF